MIALVQRVSRASVSVEGEERASIGKGFLVLVGVERGDTPEDAAYTARKVAGLRVFDDAEGKMNLALGDVGGSVLAVSQFTLAGNCEKGRRPSFVNAAPPEEAEPLFDAFCEAVRSAAIPVQTGVFRTTMAVSLVNDGPVTLTVRSRKKQEPSG